MKLNATELKSIYTKNPNAKVVLDALKSYQRNVKETRIDNLHADLGEALSYRDLIEVARQLQGAGVGNLVVGRRGGATRIAWNVPVTNLSKYATGEIESLQEEPKVQMMEHTFPVRPDMVFRAELPKDLTQNEANRLADFIRTLPFAN